MVCLKNLGAICGLLLVFSHIQEGGAKRRPAKKDKPEPEHKGNACKQTLCIPTSASNQDFCKNKKAFREAGGSVEFEEAIRDDCTQHNGRPGVEALCCPKGSLDLMLTSKIGVEPHEFPHFARLEVMGGKNKTNICGGTVYNERHVITASHCVANKTSLKPVDVKLIKIVLGHTIVGKYKNEEYEVSSVTIHPSSSLIKKNPPPTNYDIAIVKLSKNIQFNDNIKALPLAPKGFKPIDYADTAVIVGYGDTDTLTTSRKLQKADAYIRDTNENTRKGSRFHEHQGDADQLIFLGGYQHGIPSPSGSGGDSGGPAVCRDKNGEAVLCGLTSFGANNKEKCEEKKDEKQCAPTAYVRVDFFRDWIEQTAGKQKRETVMKQSLYGKDVSADKHPSQVEISSGNKKDHPCGGTLIAKDIVVTAGHCVAEDNGSMKKGLTVKQGGSSQTVKSIKVLDDFKRVGNKTSGRVRRIAVFAAKATWDDPYYQNDLALVKLSGSFKVSTFPGLAATEAYPGEATEVAWVTDSRRKGNLTEREFNLMTHVECQKRLDRLSQNGQTIKVDDNTVCGVEKYSGGSKCDRTLGGGVFCEGGKTLCGVQAFRLCQFTLPNAFVDVGLNNDWIQKNMKSLK